MAASSQELMTVFLAGLNIDMAAFMVYQKDMKDNTAQEKKDAFKAKMGAALDVDEGSDDPAIMQLIKNIKKVIIETAKEQGKNTIVPDADKAQLKENLKGHFGQPGNNPFDDSFAGTIPDVVKAIVGSFMALGYKHQSAAEN